MAPHNIVKRRSCAPWISMYEWYEVYKNIFSDTTECQLKGYERMLVWKARHPVLPSGVECTLCLIQVCLKDREMSLQIHTGKLSPYAENDLRLMYSTAIMRFLNHLSTIAQNNDETLFKIARKLHIPEWMVSLRHETAHSCALPSLNVLQLATNVALDWVHEYYWKAEAAATTDWILEESLPTDEADQNSKDIKELMDVWQALKLHTLAGYVTVRDLPDLELRNFVADVFTRRMETNNSLRATMTSMMVEETEKLDVDHMINNSYQSVGNLKLSYAVTMLRHKLLASIGQRRTEKRNKEVVDIIIERETFMPSESSMQLFYRQEEATPDLPKKLFLLWQDLLSSLHKSYSILPELLHRLILMVGDENEELLRCKLAAAWVKQLGDGAVKVRRVLRVMDHWERKGQDFIQEKLRNQQLTKKVTFTLMKKTKAMQKRSKFAIYKLAKTEIEKESPHLKNILPLKITHVPDNTCPMELLKQTILKPNKLTEIILPSLTDLVIPSLSDNAKLDLLTLVHIYTNNEVLPDYEDKVSAGVYTVQDLTQSCSQGIKIDSEDVLSIEHSSKSLPETPKSSWTRGAAYADWSTCPLGLLPWQRDRALSLDVPVSVTWQLLQLPTSVRTEDRNIPGLFKLKINWAAVVKKRPKKSVHKLAKRLKQNAKLLEMALNTVQFNVG